MFDADDFAKKVALCHIRVIKDTKLMFLSELLNRGVINNDTYADEKLRIASQYMEHVDATLDATNSIKADQDEA